MVFGSVSLAIVVLPEEVTSARSPSAGFAGLMTALSFSAGLAVQPLAWRLRDMLAGDVAGLCCAAAGAGIGIAAVAAADRVVAGAAVVLLGLAYGLCLVSGLRQAEHMASPDERGAVIACYYALAYLGFGAPYLADGLSALPGRRPERAGGQDRCVRRADRDLRGARALDGRVCGQPAPGRRGSGR